MRESLSQPFTAAVVTAVGPGLDDPSISSQLAPASSNAELLTSSEGRVVFRVEDNLRALRTKATAYANENTSRGNPKNNALIARIDQIELATISDLSLGEIPDDVDDEARIWVEVWTRRDPNLPSDQHTRIDAAVEAFAELTPDGVYGIPVFRGPERDVHVVLATGESLKALPLLLPDAAEVHLAPTVFPIVMAEAQDAAGEVADVDPPPADAAVVAVHDSGIDSTHPYVTPILLEAESVVPGEPGTTDSDGHGTQMAGVATYSRLADGLAGGLLHADAWLISMRLLDSATSSGGDPERGAMWAERTRESIETADGFGRGLPVIHNLSIGADNQTVGRNDRTAWSVAADLLAWNNGEGRLIVVAGGNHDENPDRENYPVLNLGPPFLQQPGQAWNVLTIGGYTNLDQLTAADLTDGYPEPLAEAGQLSPHSRTSAGANRPIKPDLVMEAGNTAPGGGLSNPEAQGLTVLTLRSNSALGGSLVRRTFKTSPAAAAASNALARIAAAQPTLRPATWRALLAHTARWPAAAVQQLTDRRDLLRSFGYGVPAPELATSSSSNRPVMIYEGSLQPSRRSDKAIDRRADFIELPFPEDELHAIGELPVRLTVTLSYFVEPTDNLTRRSYAGGRLRWDLQGPTEEPDAFRARINRLVRDQGIARGAGSYPWTIGTDTRSRGTLQQDFADVSAADIAGQSRLLAVYPVVGWWDDSSSSWANELPYSIVVSADLGETDVDLHAIIASTLVAVPPVIT
ncbi:S8 family serine peptidase [Kribbella sp. WER1]